MTTTSRHSWECENEKSKNVGLNKQHRVVGNIEMNFVAYALTSDNILAPWSIGDSSAMFSKRFG
jgi:hypothetical protein